MCVRAALSFQGPKVKSRRLLWKTGCIAERRGEPRRGESDTGRGDKAYPAPPRLSTVACTLLTATAPPKPPPPPTSASGGAPAHASRKRCGGSGVLRELSAFRLSDGGALRSRSRSTAEWERGRELRPSSRASSASATRRLGAKSRRAHLSLWNRVTGLQHSSRNKMCAWLAGAGASSPTPGDTELSSTFVCYGRLLLLREGRSGLLDHAQRFSKHHPAPTHKTRALCHLRYVHMYAWNLLQWSGSSLDPVQRWSFKNAKCDSMASLKSCQKALAVLVENYTYLLSWLLFCITERTA